jgi:hypothetical protein
MGAWGIKALESDNGLDVTDVLRENIPEDGEFELPKIIQLLKDEGLLAKDFRDIDFLYDNTAMALTELYLMFQDAGEIDYGGNDEDDEAKSLKRITSFMADKDSLGYVLKCLMDIKNEAPDKDGEREIVELWRDSNHWEEWRKHLDELIKRIACDHQICS